MWRPSGLVLNEGHRSDLTLDFPSNPTLCPAFLHRATTTNGNTMRFPQRCIVCSYAMRAIVAVAFYNAVYTQLYFVKQSHSKYTEVKPPLPWAASNYSDGNRVVASLDVFKADPRSVNGACIKALLAEGVSPIIYTLRTPIEFFHVYVKQHVQCTSLGLVEVAFSTMVLLFTHTSRHPSAVGV